MSVGYNSLPPDWVWVALGFLLQGTMWLAIAFVAFGLLCKAFMLIRAMMDPTAP